MWGYCEGFCLKLKHIDKKKVITGAITFFAILFIGVLINSARSTIDQAIIEATISETSQMGMQVEVAIEETLAECVEDLLLLAQHIVDIGVTEQTVAQYFDAQSQVAEFDNLFYINIDGEGLSATGETHDFSEDESFLTALSNEGHITQPHVSFVSDELVLDVAVPVVKNNEVLAVLFSEIKISDLFTIIKNYSDGSGDIFIVDSNLNMIFSTSENHIGAIQIPEDDITEMGYENVIQAQSDMLGGYNGGFYYDYYDIPKVMVYYPIQLTDWALALNVEVIAVSSQLVVAVAYFERVISIVYWTVIALVLYITFSQYRSNKVLIKTAYYDSLTGLPNLELFKILVKDMLKKHPHVKFTMQKMDIAKFSAINESYGIEIGDKLLISIAEVVNSISKDIEKTFVCARVGVDEFIMISGNNYLDREDSARDSDESKVKALVPELENHDISFRYGRYFISPDEDDVMNMITKTTIAHNMAKQNIHQKTWNYDDAYKHDMLRLSEINNKRKAALDNNEFKVYLQPKFSVSDKKLVGAEALVRWIEQDGTLNYPNDFIPLFEKNGFIVTLDKCILENVCMTLRKWLDEGYSKLTVSVNCSRLNVDNPNFVTDTVAVLDKYNLPHDCIEIELTETTTIANEDSIEQLFADLRAEGIKISIDDFGAGYSSLGMLKNLHVDTLKMDRSFFVGGKNVRRDDILIESIIKLAHSLGMYVVAEGIETEQQVEILRTMNCDAVQGYVNAKPMPVCEFEERYKDLLQSMPVSSSDIPLVRSLNDTRFAISFVPCGIVIADPDEYFTVLEANQGYFDITGYSKEEFREIFQNRGGELIHPEDLQATRRYYEQNVIKDPLTAHSYICRTTTKSGNYKTIQLNGKLAIDENGNRRLYFSIIDISSYRNCETEKL